VERNLLERDQLVEPHHGRLMSDRPPPRPRGGSVALLTAVMAAAGFALHIPMAGADPLVRPAPFSALTLVVLFAAAEVCVVHVHVRRQAHTLSLTEIPLILGVIFMSPVTVLATRLAGSAAALVLGRRQAPIKVAFNLSLFALETAIVSGFVRVAGVDPLEPSGWVVVLSATMIALVVSSAAISLVIAMVEGIRPSFTGSLTTLGPVFIGLATTSGLLSAMVLRYSPSAWVLLAAGAAALGVGLRGHASLREQHQALERAYAFTTDAVASIEVGDDRRVLLDRVGELLRAEWAELAVGNPNGDDAFVLTTRGGQLVLRTGSDAAAVLQRRRGTLAGRTSAIVAGADAPLDGFDRAVLAIVPGQGDGVGTFLVADRLGSADRFGSADCRLLETLAAQTAVALRNRALLDRLRQESADREHRALHDALTQLPNRVWFDTELKAALAARGPEDIVAVLLVDLDRFKEVNDTLGHQQGDRLLQDVARRVVSGVPGRTMVARLGGDEFAILVPAGLVSDTAGLVGIAEGLLDALATPFPLAELLVDVGASIGIAACPDHAQAATSLLQRADLAMYTAKARGSGFAVYDPADDRTSRARLGLVAELRTAIERGELRVEFQPIVELASGRTIGAEALCRWHHPTMGLVSPDVFVPVAEASGLIRPLTELVLGSALRHLRTWRDAGHQIGVSVNLSMRSLVDETLPDTVAHLLLETGVPAAAVTLEVTESSFMSEPVRAIGIVSRLSGMGLRLSIDDFGTGYSSLSQLHRLPVDEIKVDRSFVQDLALRREDVAIVRAITDLGRSLGLEVTAEGIEDGRTLQLLAGLGCHNGQGFHLSRPLSPALFDRWLRQRREESTSIAMLLDGAADVEVPAVIEIPAAS
jgi:diguanylate cyclase (GGDEF)-like protein